MHRSNERKHNFPMFCTNSLFDRKILFLHSNRSAKQNAKRAKNAKKAEMPLQFVHSEKNLRFHV